MNKRLSLLLSLLLCLAMAAGCSGSSADSVYVGDWVAVGFESDKGYVSVVEIADKERIDIGELFSVSVKADNTVSIVNNGKLYNFVWKEEDGALLIEDEDKTIVGAVGEDGRLSLSDNVGKVYYEKTEKELNKDKTE